jgi:hypothetical protein
MRPPSKAASLALRQKQIKTAFVYPSLSRWDERSRSGRKLDQSHSRFCLSFCYTLRHVGDAGAPGYYGYKLLMGYSSQRKEGNLARI